MSSAVANDGCVAPTAPPIVATAPSRRPSDNLIGSWNTFKASAAFQPIAVVVTAAIWLGAAFFWTRLCLHVSRSDTGLGWDLVTSWRATVVFAHGGQPYTRAQTAGRLFLYPPSSLLLMRPIALLTLKQVQLMGLAVTAVAAWASVMASVALVGRRWYGPTAAVIVLALHWARPMIAELGLQNATILCLVALVGFCFLATRDHWMGSAVLIGLSMSLKPLLIVLLLVFVLAKKWKPLVVAVAIPFVLNVVAFVFVSDPGEVFSKLPSLLNRAGSGVLVNAAWVDVLRTFSVPDAGIIAIRLATAGLALVAAWLAWHRIDDQVLRMVTTVSSLLLGSYLAGTLSENHYMLTMIPLLATVVIPGSPVRWFTAWIGFAWMMGLTPPASLLGIQIQANETAFMAFGMTLVLLTILVVLLARGTGASTPDLSPARNESRAVVSS